MTTRPIQYQSSATWLSLCCQSDKTMPLRLLYCQWMATRPIQYKVMPIRPNNATQITLLLMNDHSTNPIPIQCHLTVTVMPINHTMPPRLLYCQWMITQPIQYNSSATGVSLCFQLDNRTPLRIFNYHWNTSPHKVTVMQIKSHNPTQITLIPMNDHSNNPIHFQCHWTVIVLPIGWQNPQSDYFISTE